MRKEDAPKQICVWDVESTGVDITQDRILTAYAQIRTIDGRTTREQHWTLNPGVEVPKGASDVHGMTTEWIQEHGTDHRAGINGIYMFLSDAVRDGIPVVGYNNSYDLGILAHEVKRHFNFDMSDTIGANGVFFDPLVYDRAMDKFRKGGRKLMQVAAHYGIKIDESRLHEAEYDVILTAKLAWILLQKSPYTLAELQSLQVMWKHDWAKQITRYFAREGKTEEDGSPIIVDGSFPWRKELT